MGKIVICGLLALGVFTALYWVWATVIVYWLGGSEQCCILVYQNSVRTPVFSGFITMGSFLLALKSNILGRLKETYQTDEYRKSYRLEKERSGNKGLRYYADLERLSRALGWNVILCLITAFCQMTIGFVGQVWAFSICCGLATECLFLLLYLTYFLMTAHQEWFDMIEKEAQDKIKDLDKGNQQKQ